MIWTFLPFDDLVHSFDFLKILYVWLFDLPPHAKLPLLWSAGISVFNSDLASLSWRILGLRKAAWGGFGKALCSYDDLFTGGAAFSNISNTWFNAG